MAAQAVATQTARVLGPVHITVPASVAFNMEKMQSVFKSIGEKIGCGTCYSGADCFLKFERDWLVDPASLRLQGAGEVGQGHE